MPIKGLKGGIGTKPLGYGLGAAAEESEPNFNQTVLLLHGDGSEGEGNTSVLGNPNYKAFKDNSTSAHALVVNGDAYGNDFSPYYYANGYWSEYYNQPSDSGGNCNHKILPASFLNDLTIANKSTSTKTVEAWVYPTSIRTSSVQYYAMGWFCKGNIYWDCALWSTSSTTSGKFTAYHYDGTQRPLESSNYFTVGQWYHVALVIASGTIKLYVNGALEGSRTWHGLGSTGIGEVSVIGGTASNNDWNGYISNLRVSSTARYPSAFTPSTSPFTSDSDTLLLTNQSNRFVDNSSSANTFTFQNNPKITTNTPFTQSKTANVGSGYFDGTGDNLELATSADWAFGTGDFTIEMWVYAVKTTEQSLYDGRSANGAYPFLLIQNSSNKFMYYVNTAVKITANDTVPLNQWVHLALVRYSSTTKMYVNGVAQTETFSDSTNYLQAPLHIGQNQPAGSGDNFEGYLADYNVIKGTAKHTSNFTPSTSTISADSNTKLLTMQYSGAVRNVGFVDDSKYNHQITRNGDVSIGTFSPFSLEDGYWSNLIKSGDDLECGSFNKTLSNQWSFEFWYFKLDDSIDVVISTDSGDQFQCAILASTVSFYYGGGSNIDVTSNYTENNWVHFLVTKDSSNRTRLFLNGVLKGTNASSTATPTLQHFRIGDQRNTGSHPSFGYISNVRFVIGSIPTSYQTSETSVGTSVFTSPSSFLTTTSQGATSGDVELLTCQSNRFKDNSSNNFAITAASNTPEVQPFSPFVPTRSYSKDAVGGSSYFEAAGDYLSIEQKSGYEFDLDGDTDWCVEFWLYMINPSANYARVMQLDANSWAIRFEATTSKIGMGTSDAGSIEDIEDPTALPANQWTHFAFTHKNSDSTLRLFRNGALVASTTSWSPSWGHSTNPLLISRYKSGSANFFGNLYLGSFRIVKTDYIYDSAFTPPTAPFTANANTVLLMNSTNAGIIDHTMKNNLESEGNTRVSGQQIKFGTGSIYFDGTGDKLVIPHQEYHQLGTGEFTVELFVYFTSTDARQGFFGNDGGWYFQIYDGELEFALSTSAVIERSFSHSINQWYHLAATRDSSNDIRLFIDGTQQGAVVNSTADLRHASNDFHIGNIGPATSRLFKGGYMDEIRITKGVARYTSNFTVPTKAFANR